MKKNLRPLLPLIAVPITAGTGSECQSFALISHSITHEKMACGAKKLAASVAILDPLLTLTQPHFVTLITGIDAFVHAVESFVTTKRNIESEKYAMKSFQLITENFEKVLDKPNNILARANMQLGAVYVGAAIGKSMLGLCIQQ